MKPLSGQLSVRQKILRSATERPSLAILAATAWTPSSDGPPKRPPGGPKAACAPTAATPVAPIAASAAHARWLRPVASPGSERAIRSLPAAVPPDVVPDVAGVVAGASDAPLLLILEEPRAVEAGELPEHVEP